MNDYEKIMQIAIQNNNIIKTKMIVDAGIRKERIRDMLENGELERIGHGYYVLRGAKKDRYYEFQQRCPKAVFSGSTSAYLLGMSDQMPDILICTVPRGYNTSKLAIEEKVQYRYVMQEYYDIGVTEIKSPEGAMVRVYDKERTICDLVKQRRKMEPALYSHILNTYFKSREKDVQKLAKYSRIFHVVKELEMYMEVL